ncbi:MAG: uracil phosphoribosyltransferase [Micavibrio aeruginosavorus]|uniref:Uracil phosphoribosyltransferase n=1 Tax=Micavibrio aeruginosavorus TaxID=349221 RepID=A0A2W5FGX0_9BACT|nr:MAG: uracil phosphoribosyltransferase [Micavibrio aeruginosavorus]
MREIKEFPNLYIVDHPVVQDKLTTLRKKDTPTYLFRSLLEEISHLMAYPVTELLSVKDVEIETPLIKSQMPVLDVTGIVVVPILRAGLGMMSGLLKIFPDAAIGHIGLYRDHDTHQAVEYVVRLPEFKNQIYLLVDPMLGTGNSSAYAASLLVKHGVIPENIIFMSLLAAPEGVKAFHKVHPNIRVYTAALDSHLDENAYIVPGLGDAGDRMFGTA